MFGGKNKTKRKIIIDDKELSNPAITDETIEMKKTYVEAIIQDSKLPIIILDPLWLKARDHIKSKILAQGEKEIKELLKERSRLAEDLKKCTIVKQKFMDTILELSKMIQTDEDTKFIDEMNKLQGSVLKAKSKIETIEERMRQIEDEIEIRNKEMVVEMIAIGYSYIDDYKAKNDAIDTEVAQLRLKVIEKLNRKKAYEYSLKEIYSYLHSVVGAKRVEEMDKKLSHYKAPKPPSEEKEEK